MQLALSTSSRRARDSAPTGSPPRRRRRCPWPARCAGWRLLVATGPASRPASSAATAATRASTSRAASPPASWTTRAGRSLVSDLSARSFPHPFDSHPPLGARMSAVGVTSATRVWPTPSPRRRPRRGSREIGGARARSRPRCGRPTRRGSRPRTRKAWPIATCRSTADERAHVERYFPPLQLAGKPGEPALTIDCLQVHFGAWPDAVAWADVSRHQGGRPDLPRQGADAADEDPVGRKEKRNIPLSKIADGDEPCSTR